MPLPANHAFLTVGQRRIEVVHHPPPPRRPTIVFLHEGLGSVAQWRGFPERVATAANCGAFVYSRFNNGASDAFGRPRSVSYMHDEARSVLPALLQAARIERPILFGHSDGASIALIFAGTYPRAAAGVVVEAPHLFVEDISLASIAAIRETYLATDFRARMGRYHRDPAAAFFGWNDIWLHPAFAVWNIAGDLAALAVPVLAFQGVYDEYGTLAQLDALARFGAVDRVMLAACGHAPHRDREGAVIERTRQWVEEVLR